MYFLDVSCYYHDSSAALFYNGEILAAVQEERFSRKKNENKFPSNSIEYCLSFVPPGSNVKVVYFEDPVSKVDRIKTGFIHAGFRALPKYLKWKEKTRKVGLYHNFIEEFDRLYGERNYDFTFDHCAHHKSHAASAFYASPFYRSAILVVDSVGEWESTSMWKGDGNKIEKVASVDYPNSLGLLYSAFTQYCGFKVDSGEYKLMGLAPYGKPIYKDLIVENLLYTKKDGSYCLNLEYFEFKYGRKIINKKFEQLFGRESRTPESELDQFYCDVANSIQVLFNEVMASLAERVLRLTGMEKLCLAGGVALNCVANGVIGEVVGSENIWIQPAAGDAGCALGSALWAYYQENKREQSPTDKMCGALLGPEYTRDEVTDFLDSKKVDYEILNGNKYEVLADILANEKIVGLFQSRMEYGPRALGSRSIIADLRILDAQKKINMRIKFRESFRPFAPVVLKEDAKEFFNVSTYNPYMLFIGSVKEKHRIKVEKLGLNSLGESRSALPAITHVDYSARVQVVDEEHQHYLHNLLLAFKKKTGYGCLVNTSYNVRGEPIVCSLQDALNCFNNTDIDYLAYDDVLVRKAV